MKIKSDQNSLKSYQTLRYASNICINNKGSPRLTICRLTLTGGTFLISQRQFGFYFSLFVFFFLCLAAKFQSSSQLSKGNTDDDAVKICVYFVSMKTFSPNQKDKQNSWQPAARNEYYGQKFFVWHLSSNKNNSNKYK